MSIGIGGHQSGKKSTNKEWYTPKEIIDVLGPFDLDPCTSIHRPWDTAHIHYITNGLESQWGIQPQGMNSSYYTLRVWINPPYGDETHKWIKKLAEHGNGIALIFARTETGIYFPWVWDYADSILFIKGRLYFYDRYGKRAKGNAGAPSVLIAYGRNNSEILERSGIPGKFLLIKRE